MQEVQRRPIVHDPNETVDLTKNTVAASQRVKYRLNVGIESALRSLEGEGFPRYDKELLWQLFGTELLYRGQRIEEDAIGEGFFPSTEIHAGDEGVWKCDNCSNVNPPQAKRCLAECAIKVVVVDKSDQSEEGHAPAAGNGNSKSHVEAL
jgi:hypothetical protein